MGCPVKFLFTVVPGAILVLGVMLFTQATRFWMDISGPPKVDPITLTFDQPTDVEVVAFLPSSIRPELTPIDIEVETSLIGQPTYPIEIAIEVADNCTYVKIENSKTMLLFDAMTSRTQPAKSQLSTRNSRPSPSCGIIVTAQSGNSLATVSRVVPIDGWTGHLLAVAKILAGLLSSGVGLRGVLALLLGI